jgi:hypothetical protein
MTLEALATKVLVAAEASGVPFMAVGALAAGAYGVPRSTRDVDLLVAVNEGGGLNAVIKNLEEWVAFDPQVVFDTLTWGRRLVGKTREAPPYKVELFELFDDPFVLEEFSRRRQVFVPMLNCKTWLPTAEDVIIQKLRWGRNKDLDDARDVLAVQGTETLDMSYIEGWCARHQTTERLLAALASIPPL